MSSKADESDASKSISFLLNRLIVISTVTFVTSEMVVNDVNVLN